MSRAGQGRDYGQPVFKVLSLFWLRRFVVVSTLVFLCLVAVQYLQGGFGRVALWSALGWSGAAAFLAASISTYWAYRIRCRVVFHPPRD
jgi:hypothetical protein